MRKEKIEALEILVEYNERVLKNIPILVKELSGERLEDTDALLDAMVKAINWEIEVVNCTMDVLNEEKEQISKADINDKIIALSNAIKSKDDLQMAQAFQALVPVLEELGTVAKEIIA